jgi:phage shock protein C
VEPRKRLYRSRVDRLIAGVAGGMAEYWGIDLILVRILWILALVMAPIGIPAYILFWLLVPEEPEDSPTS